MARPAYGYRRDGTIDGDQAAVIVRVFAEFADPYRRPALSELAAALNTDEVPTAGGGRWFASTVKYLLQNERYAGGIVDRELWEAAQRRLAVLPMGPTR